MEYTLAVLRFRGCPIALPATIAATRVRCDEDRALVQQAESAKTQQGDGDEIVLEDSLALARQKLLLYQGLVETTAGQIMCPEDALVIIRAEKEKAAKGNAGH
ncbi:hypothetical protein N7444_007043 [Penicillium canescens]|nr:hypothetical protein N7444_007043 [Penicillium canescens]